MIAFALVFAAGLVVGLFAVPVARRSSWLGDLLALALPAACIVLAGGVLAAVAFGAPAAVVGVVLGLLVGAVVTVAMPRRRIGTPLPRDPVLIVSVNLQYDSADPESTVRSALDAAADVLVVSEATTRTDAVLARAFPYRIVTTEALRVRDNGVGVYARVPIEELPALPRYGRETLRLRVHGPRPFLLYAVHLPRPVMRYDGSPGLVGMAEHRRAVRHLADSVRAESEPVVLTGDLNLSDRMDGYRVLGDGRIDAMRTARTGTTYLGKLHWRLLMLRIDHLFLPPDWAVQDAGLVVLTGSDHRGIRARIGPRR